MASGCESLSRAKETTLRRTLLPSPKHKNLCTNIFRNTILEPASSCAEIPLRAMRRYNGQPHHEFQTNPKKTPKRNTHALGVGSIILTKSLWCQGQSLFSAGPAQSPPEPEPTGHVQCHHGVTRATKPAKALPHSSCLPSARAVLTTDPRPPAMTIRFAI